MGRTPVDREPDFADVLGASIARHYGSAGAFAEAAKVAESSVSRWLSRSNVPSRETIERIAPRVLDIKGNPIPAARLVAIAHPGSAPATGTARVVYIDRPDSLRHRLALEADELLSPDGPLSTEMRKNLETLIDSLFAPYRSRTRKRKAG